MKKIYNYIYYKLYCYMVQTPNRGNAEDGAVILLSSIILIYSLTLFIASKLLVDFGQLPKNRIVIVGLLIAYLIYFLNRKYFKNRTEQITKEFSQESKYQKILGGILVLLVGVGSLASFIITGIYINGLSK